MTASASRARLAGRPDLAPFVSGGVTLPLAADLDAYLDLARFDAADAARLREAYRFGRYWHDGQERKGTERPYFVHPIAVAGILSRRGASADLVAAGLLHDVVEDTPVGTDEIAERFGVRVAALVAAVTKPGRPWQTWHLVPDAGAALLKAADLACNLADTAACFDELGPAVWRRFRMGRHKLDTWDGSLRQVEAVLAGGDGADLAATVRALLEWLRATPAK